MPRGGGGGGTASLKVGAQCQTTALYNDPDISKCPVTMVHKCNGDRWSLEL